MFAAGLLAVLWRDGLRSAPLALASPAEGVAGGENPAGRFQQKAGIEVITIIGGELGRGREAATA